MWIPIYRRMKAYRTLKQDSSDGIMGNSGFKSVPMIVWNFLSRQSTGESRPLLQGRVVWKTHRHTIGTYTKYTPHIHWCYIYLTQLVSIVYLGLIVLQAYDQNYGTIMQPWVCFRWKRWLCLCCIILNREPVLIFRFKTLQNKICLRMNIMQGNYVNVLSINML